MTNAAIAQRDTIVPRSIRFHLRRDEAAAVLAVTGVQPDGRLLAPLEPSVEPAAVVPSAGRVDDGGVVPPFLVEAMTVAASPRRCIRALTAVPGSEDWANVLIGAAADGGPYVTVGVDDEHVDVFAIETAMEIAAVFDDLFRLTVLPARPVDPDIAMTLAAWLGLLAVADIRRMRRLRNELRRRPEGDGPFTLADIDGALTVGLGSADSRWAVSAAVPIAPVPVRDRQPAADQVVDELATLGMVAPTEGGHELTALGADLVEVVERSIQVGSITLTHRLDERDVRGGEMLIYRSPTRLLIGIWTGTAESPLLTLLEPTPEAAVAMIRRLVEIPIPASVERTSAALPPPPFDASHFVGSGGADVRQAPEARTPVAAHLDGGTGVRILERRDEWMEIVVESGERGWLTVTDLAATPTHRVGEGGTTGWNRPDPSTPATARLPAAARVTLIEESGAWARVRTEQGQEVWVDGRHLIPV